MPEKVIVTIRVFLTKRIRQQEEFAHQEDVLKK